MTPCRSILGAVLAALLSLPQYADAKALNIGLAAEPTSIDPHLHNLAHNNSLASHIFSRLVEQDEKQRVVPGVASEWKSVDGRTWEFKLRKDVRFHDGTPLTADDVVFSWQRASKVDGSPLGFEPFTRDKTVTRIDDHTVRITTRRPHALMLHDAASVHLVSRKHATGASSADFDSGKAAIGTGPYRLERYVPGDRIVLARNEAYYGEKPLWTTVTFKPLTSSSQRVAALRSGDVDLIEQVPTEHIERLKKAPNMSLSQGVSSRVLYLHMDQFREDSPFVRARDGSTMKNPLLDVRVRKAISKAIDRDAIVELMNGAAVKAGQLLPEGFFGRSASLRAETFDPEAASTLLAAAGLPDGFRLSVHGPRGRYMNDSRIAEAIGRMLTRIGIETEVVSMPPRIFFKRATRGGRDGMPEFSVVLVGWASATGETSSALKSLLHTYDKPRRLGTSNRGRHSDPEVDTLVENALHELDDDARAVLLARAVDKAIGSNQGIIPIHYQVSTWAAKKGLRYIARSDERTRAMETIEQ